MKFSILEFLYFDFIYLHKTDFSITHTNRCFMVAKLFAATTNVAVATSVMMKKVRDFVSATFK